MTLDANTALVSLAIGIAIFFIKDIYATAKKKSDKFADNDSSFTLTLALLQKDVAQLTSQIADINSMVKRIDVINQEFATEKSRIAAALRITDEIKAQILVLRERDHLLANKLHLIQGHMELKLADPDWELPKFPEEKKK